MKNPRHVKTGSAWDVHPLTADRWADFARLFGARGACGGCWCMLWRLSRAEFERGKGAGNEQSMRRIVDGRMKRRVALVSQRLYDVE